MQPGGHHDGQGSHNRIVPLGPGYLELLAIDDPEEAAASPIGRILQEVLTGDGLLAYAVFVDDIQRLGLEVHTVSRDGLTASVAGVEEALREPFLPFFVSSDRPRTWPPGRGPDVGRGGGRRRPPARLAARRRSCRSASSRATRRCARSGIGEREFRP